MLPGSTLSRPPLRAGSASSFGTCATGDKLQGLREKATPGRWGEIRGDLGASASATFGKMMFCSTVARISPAEYASA